MIIWAHRLQPGDIIHRRQGQDVDELVLEIRRVMRSHEIPNDEVELKALCQRQRHVVAYRLPSFEHIVIDIPNR